MTYTEGQKKDHVYDLQNALYHLSLYDATLPRVVPDGIYGPETSNCVRHMQRRHGLPETGRVDHDTWKLIFSQYAQQREHHEKPLAVATFADAPMRIEKGYVDAGIGMVQAMLWELSKHYKNIVAVPVTMVYDAATIDQMHKVQRLSGLSESDVLDNKTWNALTKLYHTIHGK
ncbi:MAG: peptidoglycan-binding protein [Intestinibacillus sp.]